MYRVPVELRDLFENNTRIDSRGKMHNPTGRITFPNGSVINGIDVNDPPIQSVTPAGIQLVSSPFVPEGTAWFMSDFREPEDFERQFMVRPMQGGPDLASFEDRVRDVMRSMERVEVRGAEPVGVMTVDPPRGHIPAPEFEGDVAVLTEDVKAPEDYVALAEKLGVVPKKLMRTLFRRFLQREEIPVYDYTAVDRYLSKRCQWMQGQKPMRGGYFVDWVPLPVKGSATEQTTGAEVDTIPIEALQTIERVQSGFDKAEKVEWYVSAIKGDPDPFLAAKYMGEMYVLLHWDEPGFSVTD